jgi:hypothetical protein
MAQKQQQPRKKIEFQAEKKSRVVEKVPSFGVAKKMCFLLLALPLGKIFLSLCQVSSLSNFEL